MVLHHVLRQIPFLLVAYGTALTPEWQSPCVAQSVNSQSGCSAKDRFTDVAYQQFLAQMNLINVLSKASLRIVSFSTLVALKFFDSLLPLHVSILVALIVAWFPTNFTVHFLGFYPSRLYDVKCYASAMEPWWQTGRRKSCRREARSQCVLLPCDLYNFQIE